MRLYNEAMSVRDTIVTAAGRYGVPPDFALSVARIESSYNPAALSARGAIGVMQLMPATAAGLGVNPYDTDENIDGGVRYLRQMYDRFGDWALAAAAYNAGPGTLEKVLAGLRSLPAETVAYVGKLKLSLPFAESAGLNLPALPSNSGLDFSAFAETGEAAALRPAWLIPAALAGAGVLLAWSLA